MNLYADLLAHYILGDTTVPHPCMVFQRIISAVDLVESIELQAPLADLLATSQKRTQNDP
jgi:hypothetical protein